MKKYFNIVYYLSSLAQWLRGKLTNYEIRSSHPRLCSKKYRQILIAKCFYFIKIDDKFKVMRDDIVDFDS